MSRSVTYRREISDACNWHQEEALNCEIYLLYNTGPTGFLLKEEGEPKNLKVFLGDTHTCTCAVFKKEKDLCKHICWLLMKKFRIDRNNPLTWQLGLCEREINDVLRGAASKEATSKIRDTKNNQLKIDKAEQGQNGTIQRDIGDEDMCPICQDNFMEKRQPVTYCRLSCGNNVHIKCMKIWADHQRSNGETKLKCPLCREEFSTFEMLEQEFHNNKLFKLDRQSIHHGLACNSCQATPINGKCYKCSKCKEIYLCQACFNTDFHKEHQFIFREKDNMKYKKAVRDHVGSTLPLAIANNLVTRNIHEQDYDLLLQLDEKPCLSRIPERVIKTWRLEHLRDGHKLLIPGVQCRVCLREFKIGELVRRLPRCKHRFHADCIDNWLLHSHPTCPIDGIIVWEPNRHNEEKVKPAEPHLDTSNAKLDVPSIGLCIKPLLSTIEKKDSSSSSPSMLHSGHLIKLNKILRQRALNSNPTHLANTSKMLEINGQNVSSHNLFERNFSASSEASIHSISNGRVNRPLPKIAKKLERNETEIKLNDVFSIEPLITKPYQLSRFDRTSQQKVDHFELDFEKNDDYDDAIELKSNMTHKPPILRKHQPAKVQRKIISTSENIHSSETLSINGQFLRM